MIKNLLTLLKKPSLWQRSSEAFWDDEHISKGMLDAHLDPDWDSSSRKHVDIDRCVNWLSTVIPSGSNILDLGCGPGLYTKRLSDLGYSVTGMDYSKRSLAYAKKHDTKTEYIYKNYLELDIEATFDVITIINGDYAALTLPERQALLTRIYNALKPGGVFIFDVFTVQTTQGKTDNTRWSIAENGGFMNAQPHVSLEASYYYQNNTVLVDQYVILTDEGIHEYLIWNTLYTKETLTDEVTPFGFQIKGVHDDECGSPYTGEFERICFMISKPE